MKTNKIRLVETRARDALRSFLLGRERQPLDVFLSLFFDKNRPEEFHDLDALKLPAEDIAHTFQSAGEKRSTARSDLIVKSDGHVLVVEIKVDAEESLNQYDKYQAAYEEKGYKTKVVGLIDRIKTKARIKDHEPFLKKYKRVLWSELLDEFSRNFSKTQEFKEFVGALEQLSPTLGKRQRPPSLGDTASRSVELLGNNTEALRTFYQDFSERLTEYETVPFQAGSTGYELHIGRPGWADVFDEPRFQRISLALNPYSSQIDRLHQEPYFAFCILLWNRSTFRNIDSFLEHGPQLARQLRSRGFEVVRNRDGWKKGNAPWESPFLADSRMCFANAFWEHKFSLPRSQFLGLEWEELQLTLLQEFHKLAKTVDTIGSKIQRAQPVVGFVK
jgi:hypothetical protein